MSINRTCDNCHEIIQSDYKFCPICGHDLSIRKNNGTLGEDFSTLIASSEKLGETKLSTVELICKILGSIILLFDFLFLIWFSWTGYVGHLVKYNKPIPETIFSIDAEFFNLAGSDSFYNTFLIVFIVFGLMKVGFWLIKFKSPSAKL